MRANQNIARALNVIDQMSLNGTNIPLLLMSRPGFGKTSTIAKFCEYKDYNLYSLIASQYSSDDILGLQTLKNGKLERVTPAWFDEMEQMMQNGKRTILFLDEITCVDEWIQGSLLDLIFSRKLGTKKLSDNVLVLAAGNYSKDLNNAFKMTAPLINRFMILNIWNNDFDVMDFINDSFERVNSKEEIGEYLGIAPEKPRYDFDKFKAWVGNSNEVVFSKSEYTEDDDYGLLGFTSIRSLSYSLKFAEAYTNTYSDKLWMRVVGDTLGVSSVRSGKHLRSVLEACSNKFIEEDGVKRSTLNDICSKILTNNTYTDQDLTTFRNLIDMMDPNNLTSDDLRKIYGVTNKFCNDPKIVEINKLLTKKISMY